MYGDSTRPQRPPGRHRHRYPVRREPAATRLVAGLGTDALYGSIGNDTFQLPFTPAGQTQPNDTLVGGGGADTLVLKAESGTGTAGLNVTANAIPDATTTSVTVSNGLAVAADLPSDGSGLVIQIVATLTSRCDGGSAVIQIARADSSRPWPATS